MDWTLGSVYEKNNVFFLHLFLKECRNALLPCLNDVWGKNNFDLCNGNNMYSYKSGLEIIFDIHVGENRLVNFDLVKDYFKGISKEKIWTFLELRLGRVFDLCKVDLGEVDCSLVLPYLNYCNHIWGNTYKYHLSKLYILQKKAVRIITKSHVQSPSAPLFKELQIHYYQFMI